MNKQRGFTLLEIIVALVIFALSAMMVVTTIPSRSGADTFGQQLKSLVEYGSDRAVMDGNIVGLVMTSSEFELVTQVVNNGERHWAPLSRGGSPPAASFLRRCMSPSHRERWRPRWTMNRKSFFCRTASLAASRSASKAWIKSSAFT